MTKNIEISQLLKGDIGFKSARYDAGSWDPKKHSPSKNSDENWKGIYIAEIKETAEGYLSDVVPNGNGEGYIHKVRLKTNVNLITCFDEGFKTGDIDMKKLKEALREKNINVEDKKPLISNLGELKYFFRCYNNAEGEMEIIVPASMAETISLLEYQKIILKNHQIFDRINIERKD